MKMLTIDIESTGIPQKGADYKIHYMDYPYIVSLAYKINGGETKEFIINQEGRKIPPETIAIHGITDEIASNSSHNILDVMGNLLFDGDNSNFVIGHNIYFDSSIIKANLLRLINKELTSDGIYRNLEELLHKDKRIDTMRAGQKLCGGRWPKLDDLHLKLFGELPKESHRSGKDVDTTYKCYLELVNLGIIKLPEQIVEMEEV